MTDRSAALDAGFGDAGLTCADGAGAISLHGSTASSGTPAHTAFPALYPALVAFFARRTRSREDAEDLAHDLYLRVAEQRGEAQSPRAYLFAAARHLLVDRARAQHREAEALQALALGSEQAHAPPADRCAHHRRLLGAVSSALAGLPQRQRDVWCAQMIDGLDHPSIAARCGIGVNTVERDSMAAQKALAAALDPAASEDSAHRHAGRRRLLARVLGLGALGGTYAAAWQVWQSWAGTWRDTIATATGQRQQLTLPDGSRVDLDAASVLHGHYSSAQRHIELVQGGAYFTVVPDGQRAFTVSAGAARVTVTGTAFAVEHESGGVTVTVSEGAIALHGVRAGVATAALVLRAGERVHVAADGALGRPEHTDPADAAPWRHGELLFDDIPLGEALARLARYGLQGWQAEGSAAALRVSGRIRIAHAHAWLAALPAALPVRIERGADGSTRLVARPSAR